MSKEFRDPSPYLRDRNIISISTYCASKNKLYARIISCQNQGGCQWHSEGKCLLADSRDFEFCPYGHVVTLEGYSKFSGFFSKWSAPIYAHPKFQKLKPAGVVRFCRIGEFVMLYPQFAGIAMQADRDADLKVADTNSPGVRSKFWIKRDECTPDFLDRLFSLEVRDRFGDIIPRYAERIVPSMIAEIKSKDPELFGRLAQAYPKYAGQASFKGQIAYIKTMRPGSRIKTNGGIFVLSDDRTELVCDDYRPAHQYPFDVSRSELQEKGLSVRCIFPVTDSMTAVIDDESQADENTRLY